MQLHGIVLITVMKRAESQSSMLEVFWVMLTQSGERICKDSDRLKSR
jgi:hypothetical protein